MRLADPLSTTEDNVPVAIFSLGEQRMFLPVSEGYQDMLRRVAEDFDLEEDVVLSFRTSTIDACRGREVVIPESAYIHLWKYLDEVDVSIVEQAKVSRRQQKQAQEERGAISPITPEYPSSPLKDIETEDFLAASSTVIHEEAPLDEERVGSHTPISDDIGRGVVGSSSKVVTEKMGGRVAAQSQKSKNADNEQIDDDQFVVEVSQAKAVRVPLKIADLKPIAEPESSGEGKSDSPKKFKPQKSNKAIGSPVTLKKEILAESFNEESMIVKNKTSASQPEDLRFEITIIGPRNEAAQFKTRGGHPVRKVLAAACRTFGIKYERSRLILCVSSEDGGEVQTDEFDCPPEETISQCGVDSHAKLFVRVEPDLDEVYEDD